MIRFVGNPSDGPPIFYYRLIIRNFASITTPRSIEDLTTDEKYGSFMPASNPSKTPDSRSNSMLPLEDLELEGKIKIF